MDSFYCPDKLLFLKMRWSVTTEWLAEWRPNQDTYVKMTSEWRPKFAAKYSYAEHTQIHNTGHGMRDRNCFCLFVYLRTLWWYWSGQYQAVVIRIPITCHAERGMTSQREFYPDVFFLANRGIIRCCYAFLHTWDAFPSCEPRILTSKTKLSRWKPP